MVEVDFRAQPPVLATQPLHLPRALDRHCCNAGDRSHQMQIVFSETNFWIGRVQINQSNRLIQIYQRHAQQRVHVSGAGFLLFGVFEIVGVLKVFGFFQRRARASFLVPVVPIYIVAQRRHALLQDLLRQSSIHVNRMLRPGDTIPGHDGIEFVGVRPSKIAPRSAGTTSKIMPNSCHCSDSTLRTEPIAVLIFNSVCKSRATRSVVGSAASASGWR